ncbi:hypothetical protein EAH80_07280 [Mycobacterium hodleri]|uniref:DUF4242 domain-containing protein n=1 Tax=Mycolicibacterium hodleri TaxID=49897 RepID=A0A502EHM9_9MYCO|nr:hypothetical protein EAH80_07280 [Mycolicibacterium hodleri]
MVNSDIDYVTTTLGDSAAHLNDQGHPVRLLTVFTVPIDQVLYGLYAAESADDITHACESVGWPVDRITGGVHTRTPRDC